MALRPGGPLGDMVSQNQYATELEKQPAPQPAPQVSQPDNRQVDHEAAKLKNLAENDRVAERRINESPRSLRPSLNSSSSRPPQKQNEQGR